MILPGRDVVEVEALVTDRYLDSLLMAGDQADEVLDLPGAGSRRRAWFLTGLRHDAESARLDQGVRLASERLTRDLPRFHPSFRFEERLAVRLAEAAAAMRLSVAAGAGGSQTIPFPGGRGGAVDPLSASPVDGAAGQTPRPLLVGSAVAASAISLAGAAWMAWRRARPSGSPMARAARAAHATHGRPTPAIRGRLV